MGSKFWNDSRCLKVEMKTYPNIIASTDTSVKASYGSREEILPDLFQPSCGAVEQFDRAVLIL